MINLKNIQFSYSKKVPLFKNIDLELKSGHIFGLLGKNGAGKTTLLKIISGLCFPKQGSAEVFGFRSEFRSPEFMQRIFFLTEDLFIPHLTVENYVKSYASFYPNFDQDKFISFIKAFEMESTKGYLDQMSYGQKKKVIISFALATNCELLIMDEPTNGLDIPSKIVFRKVMASAATEEQLILISTHQVRDLHSLIDAVIIIENGEILLNASNDTITEKLFFQYEDDDDNSPVLYQEDSLKGIFAVKENLQHRDSKLDLELLFNAVLLNNQKVKEIFKS
ncbi:MAG: ABC transporter ATP-binding protein [Bacteroidales bacterium]|jgi:ABC-2 type transport system ATP-binding protein|nr:ABC transporter ATP-binding protein [Bacteroidales bacterium]